MEAKIFAIKHKPSDCAHKRTTLNMESRLLECRDCERVIDPFDWIFSQAVGEDTSLHKLKRLREEIAMLEKQVASLKRQKVFLSNQPIK